MVPKYDLVLYGATGFTGKLVATYLNAVPDLAGRSWAIAGRTESKLEALKSSLTRQGVHAVHLELTDEQSVDALVSSTRAVINCAGPFSQYHAESLISACARRGVHYSDLAGESFWQKEMADKYHGVAQQSGARIVFGGGIDSIPSDLGAMLAFNGLPHAETSGEVKMRAVYTEYTGSFSGGTLASGRAMAKARKEGRVTDDMEANPYLICPSGQTGADTVVGTADGMPTDFKWGFRRHQPFFMAPINARIVRRSLALRGLAERVSYAECSSNGLWLRMIWVLLSRGFGYLRGAPINFAPKPGEGPPAWLIDEGAFTLELTATAASGAQAVCVVKGKGDPGYGATAKMLAECGLCLSLDELSGPGGVLTPWTGLGEPLVSRLRRAEEGRFMALDVNLKE